MAVNTKITGYRLKQHWYYNSWKYMLIVLITAFSWNLIYSVTRYRPPAEKRLYIYMVSSIADADKSNEYLENFRKEYIPETEEVYAYTLMEDESTLVYQMATFTAAGEGDFYILPRDIFENYTGIGAFVDLSEYIAGGELRLGDLDVSDGYLSYKNELDDETFETVSGQFAIPLRNFYGLMDEMNLDNRELYLCLSISCKNTDGALALMNYLVENEVTEPPQWVIDVENAKAAENAAATAAPAATDAAPSQAPAQSASPEATAAPAPESTEAPASDASGAASGA